MMMLKFLKLNTLCCTEKVVLPQRGSDSYLSVIGHIDTRLDLHKFPTASASEEVRELEGKALVDLCIMASKLAYENTNVVKNVVINHWKV
jgi:hypothetical protein